MANLSILIVNWNTRELLRACLFSLRQNLSHIDHEIIVVDNDSNDDSAGMVSREFPEVKLTASKTNLGFAEGNNLAFEKSSGEYIWLLNPDTEVFEGAAEKLIAFLGSNPNAGGVASALIDARDGHIQRSCRTFPTPAALWSQALGLAAFFPRSKRFGFYKMGWWNYADTRQVEQPMASSFLIRREAIESIGELFDEQFPIYFNDVDLCWRLIERNWEIWFLPDAKVKHYGGASTGQIKPAMIEESHRCLRRFYNKAYRGKISTLIFWPTVWMTQLAGKARVLNAKRKAAK
jgi:GT2 family glycosyltransferase